MKLYFNNVIVIYYALFALVFPLHQLKCLDCFETLPEMLTQQCLKLFCDISNEYIFTI